MKGACAVIGIIAGNFLYQALNDHDWSTALERSFFQLVAVGLYAAITANG